METAPMNPTRCPFFAATALALVAAAILGITATAKLFPLPVQDTAALRAEAATAPAPAPAPARRVFCAEGGNSRYSTLHGGFVCGTE